MMTLTDRTHYDVLGIAPDADARAVRSAWKLHVQAWHPDRFSGEMREEAERQTARINEAYTTLRDSARRAAYDCRLAAEVESSTPTSRRSTKVRPAAPRPAATPVGTPMSFAPQAPLTLQEQAAAATRDVAAAIRRHPRITAAAVAVWALVFGGSVIMHAVAGPSLPSSPVSAPSASVSKVDDELRAESSQQLQQLARQAEQDAAAAAAQMQELMRQDELAAAAEARAMAKAEAAARRRDPRAGAQAAPAVPKGGRVIRVLPQGS